MGTTISAALVALTLASGLWLEIEGPGIIEFGTPWTVKATLRNTSDSPVMAVKPLTAYCTYLLTDVDAGKWIMKSNDRIYRTPGWENEVAVELGPGASLVGGVDPIPLTPEVPLDSGRVHGLLWPGRYSIEIWCPGGSAKTELTVVEGKRSRELAIVREVVAAYRAYSGGEEKLEELRAGLRAARKALADLDPRSPVLEAFWPASCAKEGTSVKMDECRNAFVATFPRSRFGFWLPSRIDSAKRHEEEILESRRRNAAATKEEHWLKTKVITAHQPGSEDGIRLANEFMAKYPNSAHTPEVLQTAIFLAIRAGRQGEAEVFAQKLIDRFPESMEVKRFMSSSWLLPDPSNSTRPQKRKLRRWESE